MSLGLPDYTAIIQFFLFFATLFILNNWVFTPLLRVIEERRKKTIGSLKEAEQLIKFTEKLLHQYETELRAHKVLLHERIEKTHQEANRRYAEESLKAKDKLQKSLKERRQALSKEARRAKEELLQDIDSLALDAAQKMIGAQVL